MRPTVLLADFEKDLREAIGSVVMGQYNAWVLEVENIRGYELADVSRRRDIALIVINNDMLGTPGFRGIPAVRENSSAPIYVVGANDVWGAAIRAGATGFIPRSEMAQKGVATTLEPILDMYLSRNAFN